MTEQKAFTFPKIELLPARKPTCKSFPAFLRRGQNVFITCYKNIQGWLNAAHEKCYHQQQTRIRNIAALRKQVGV